MSDQEGGTQPPAPGWWLASDGNWYPPEQAPQAQQVQTAPPPGYGGVPSYPPLATPTNGMATAALVLGIVGASLGIIPFFFFIAWILGVLALVLGLIAKGRAKQGLGFAGRATAGWILGLVAIGLGILGVVIINAAEDRIERRFDDITSARGVEIKQTACESDNGQARATGTLKNTTDFFKSVDIEVHFVIEDGTEFGNGTDLVNIDGNGSSSYEISDFIGDHTVTKCNIEVS